MPETILRYIQIGFTDLNLNTFTENLESTKLFSQQIFTFFGSHATCLHYFMGKGII